MIPRFKNKYSPLSFLVSACLAGLISGCLVGNGRVTRQGYAFLNLDLARTEDALSKRSTLDTTFSLDSLFITLSAAGAVTQKFSYPIQGRADTGNIAVGTKIFALNPLRKWTARIMTIGISQNPYRRDTVHLDSVSFPVQAADTSLVSKTVSPVYSILRARFISSDPDSIPYGIRFLRLRVDGITRDSINLLGSRLNGVHFPTTTVGYAVGDSGRIKKSTDGGQKWNRLESGTGENLQNVWFASTTVGWIVGTAGLIRKTTNGGTSWVTQSGNTSETLKRVLFLDANVGLIFGSSGTLLKTVNGGADWFSVAGEWSGLGSGTTSNLKSLCFSSTSTGWIVGASGTIRKTLDGGLTWSSQNAGSQQFNSVSFSGATGYVAGNGGVIYRTTNGTSWSSQSSGVTQNLNAIQYNGSRAWVVGNGGTLRRTTNGTSWSSRTSGTTNNLFGVFFVTNNEGWIVGAGGVIRHNTNANNNSWSAQTSGTTQQLNAVFFWDNNIGWVAGNGGVIRKTTNGGSSWSGQTSGTTENLYSIRFASANIGYAVAASGVVLKTTNGGTDWLTQPSSVGSPLNGVYPVDTNSVFAVGDAGTFIRTLNGGVRMTAESYNSAHFRGDTGYVVGDGGIAMRTLDAGDFWTTLTTHTTSDLNAVFSTGNYAYAAGDAGTILTIPHDGTSLAFTTRNSATTRDLHGIWGSPTVGSTRAYVVGDSGELRSITSVTQTWSALSSGTDESLRAIHCSGTGSNCWIVGDNEVVLGTTTGTTWIEKTAGAKTFDQLLAFKYLKPGQSHTIVIGAIDTPSPPLRGYQGTITLIVGAGQDSTVVHPLARCGYGGSTPDCLP